MKPTPRNEKRRAYARRFISMDARVKPGMTI
jgi:hypothetical protein